MKKILLIVMIASLFVIFASKVYARGFYHHEGVYEVEDCPRRNQAQDTQNNVANKVVYYDCGNPNCHRTDEHTHDYETNGYHHSENGHNHAHGRHHR